MHIYVYDSFVNQKKYNKVLFRLETRLTDLGLNGKICRLGVMQSIASILESEIRQGPKTIVAVGNDATIHKVINGLTDYNIPLGFIPIGQENNSMANSLGIELEELACDVLSRRKIEKLDLGIANQFYFLSQASITTQGTTIEINKRYTIEIMEKGEVNIINLITSTNLPANTKSTPHDGKLELAINTGGAKKTFTSASKNQSFFSFKKLTILNKNHPLVLDKAVKIPAPIEISIVKKKISMIVGKARNF